MKLSRRNFVGQTAGSLLASGLAVTASASAKDDPASLPIVDTHQHLWDLEKLRLPWLKDAPATLKQSYTTREYADATRGLNVVQAVYMEVDVDPTQHDAEAEYVVELARSGEHPTVAAVVGGRPASPRFADYIKQLKQSPYIKGIRQVLHVPGAKTGLCLEPDFVRGVQLLGEQQLSFDLCLRPTELADGMKLADACPETRFVLDHCGNADPKAFLTSMASAEERLGHDPEDWKRDIEQFARRKNVVCKISGIVARAPKNWKADQLAPIVDHCLDTFGPDRVVFGGDWPVCLLGAMLRQWVMALREIVAERPEAEQLKVWHDNAVRWYGLMK